MMSNLRQYDTHTATLIACWDSSYGTVYRFEGKVNWHALLRARMRPDWSDSINPELCDTDTVCTVERQWLEHHWLVKHGYFEFVPESLGKII